MSAFVGSKVALFCEGKLLVFLRDDKPDIWNPNMWDFFGGGREGEETPQECAMREIEEETGIRLSPSAFIWQKAHPSLNDASTPGYFFVAHLSSADLAHLHLTEGQRWELMDTDEFLARPDAVEGMKIRLRDYLENGS